MLYCMNGENGCGMVYKLVEAPRDFRSNTCPTPFLASPEKIHFKNTTRKLIKFNVVCIDENFEKKNKIKYNKSFYVIKLDREIMISGKIRITKRKRQFMMIYFGFRG